MKKWLSEKIKYCWDYATSYLDTRFKQIGYFTGVALAILAAAYITAVFDIGFKIWDFSIGAMLKAYWKPKYTFPWGVWLILTFIILYFAVFIIWKHGTPPGNRNFTYSKSNVYGSSKEMGRKELEEVANIVHKDATVDLILGQLDKEGKQVIAQKPRALPNQNMVVFGPPGCGKSCSYVLPFIMQKIMSRESLIVTDTKGEVYAKTVEAARYNGYQVLRLDLKNPEYSDGWHVLKELRHNYDRLLTFVEAVALSSGNLTDTFMDAQKGLLTSVCLYTERMPSLPESERTFYHAMSMILEGPAKLDKIMETALSAYPDEMMIVGQNYSTFRNGSPNLRDNIVNGLANRLRILISPEVRNMTSVDEIDFASIGKQPTILYISMSDQDDTKKFLASLAFTFAIQDLIDYADSQKQQRTDVPVHLLFEEFCNLGRVPNIDRTLSTARSRGISTNLVIQSLGQLHEIYEENMTNTILADCSIWMALGCNDEKTAKLLEWRSGLSTVKVKTEQHDAVESVLQTSFQHSTGDGKRYVYTSNEIMNIKAQKEVFIVWQMHDTMITNAFPIFLHREFQDDHMPMVPSNGLIPLTNRKAKAKFRQWENQRIASFNRWMNAGGNPLRDYKGFPPKKRGIFSRSDRPDIEPIHVLQNMALAWANKTKYEPTKDPYNPLYIPVEDPNAVDQDQNDETEFFELEEEDFIFMGTVAQQEPASSAQTEQPPATQHSEPPEPAAEPEPSKTDPMPADTKQSDPDRRNTEPSEPDTAPARIPPEKEEDDEENADSTVPIFMPRKNIDPAPDVRTQSCEETPAERSPSNTPASEDSTPANTPTDEALESAMIQDLFSGKETQEEPQRTTKRKRTAKKDKPLPKTALENKNAHKSLDEVLPSE